MKKQVEILAPAGSYDGMRAAMNAGCDAVYIGGSSFGARAYADNPDTGVLLRAIDEAHIRGKKLYLTVNTLLKEDELAGQLYSFLEKYYLQGLDAVIVQDVGVLHFIHEHFPKLPIHASTQMTLTMAQGANLLKDYGVTRLVASRELSLKEIQILRENTKLEIEAFVHGALCYCYSGQCLMSSIIGGRSGNRGRCAQPCRMPYQLFLGDKKLSSDQEKYLLSPKDINMAALIPELIEAGINSFKIEGRMKRPEYAAAVSMVYRKCVDLYYELGKDGYDQYLRGEAFAGDMIKLQDVFNRGGFSEGYIKTYHGRKMMSMGRPNHSGVSVGEVASVSGSRVSIILTERINAQDVLEIRGGQDYEFTVKDSLERGELLTANIGIRPGGRDNHKDNVTASKGDSKNGRTKASGRVSETAAAVMQTQRKSHLQMRADVRKTAAAVMQTSGNRKNSSETMAKEWRQASIRRGDKVYRTRNNALLNELARDYLERDVKRKIRGSLKAVTGERLSLTVTCGDCTVTAYQGVVQEALKQPMTADKLLAPLQRTGDTFVYFEELSADAGDNIFVPVAWLNDIRREAIRLLEERIAEKYRRSGEDEWNTMTAKVAFNDTDIDYGSAPYNSGSKGTAACMADQCDSGPVAYGNIPMSGGQQEISVSVMTKEQFDIALTFPEVTSLYVDYDMLDFKHFSGMAEEAADKEKAFYLTLPYICRQTVYEKLKEEIVTVTGNASIRGYIVRNFEEIALLRSLYKNVENKPEILINHNVYVFNTEAKKFWRELGISRFCAPIELNYRELKQLGVSDCDLLVYGYLPLMVSAQCLFENTGGCLKDRERKCGTKGTLTDRMDKKFIVKTNCRECCNVIYNGQCLSLLKHANEAAGLKPYCFRLDFTIESGEDTRQVIQAFLDTFLHGKKAALELPNVTSGHFKRGVD